MYQIEVERKNPKKGLRIKEIEKMYDALKEELEAVKTFAEQAWTELVKTDLKDDKQLRKMISDLEDDAEGCLDWINSDG